MSSPSVSTVSSSEFSSASVSPASSDSLPTTICAYTYKQKSRAGLKCRGFVTEKDPKGLYCCAHYRCKSVLKLGQPIKTCQYIRIIGRNAGVPCPFKVSFGDPDQKFCSSHFKPKWMEERRLAALSALHSEF